MTGRVVSCLMTFPPLLYSSRSTTLHTLRLNIYSLESFLQRPTELESCMIRVLHHTGILHDYRQLTSVGAHPQSMGGNEGRTLGMQQRDGGGVARQHCKCYPTPSSAILHHFPYCKKPHFTGEADLLHNTMQSTIILQPAFVIESHPPKYS